MDKKSYSYLKVSFVGVFCFVVFVLFSFVFKLIYASEVVGTIDSVSKYAKLIEQNEAKIKFNIFQGTSGVHIYDNLISGFVWGEKIGWINFAPEGWGVQNDGEGNLSGYATSEYGGWVDFSQVKINKDGEFLGYAISKNFGKIIFNCVTNDSCSVDDFKVKTDWRPISIRNDGTIKPPTPLAQSAPPDVIPKKNQEEDDNTTDTNKKNLSLNDGKNVFTDSSTNSNTEVPAKKIIFDVNTKNIITEEQQKILDAQIENNLKPVTPIFVGGNNNISSVVKNTTNEIKKDAVVIVETPAVAISTKAITTAGVAGGGTVVISSLFNSLFSFSELFLTLFRLWSIVLSALGLRKKRVSWGTVYDSVTKQPLDPAYVVLKDKFGKVVATSITDLDGRYGFLVKPGIYHIVAKKTNYISPSIKLHGHISDELYDNLYFGEDIEIADNKIVNKNIPMDPERFDWNEFAKRKMGVMKFHSQFSLIFAKISNILFSVGLFFAIGLFVVKPDGFNVAILVIYIVLFILRKANKKVKSFGTISDHMTGRPLAFAIIRVFMKNDVKKEIFHRVTDEFGHYYCLLGKGEYFITIERKNNDESYTKVYTSDTLLIKGGILKQDFIV